MKKTEKYYIDILTKASDAYYNGEAIMSDDDFDKVYDEFKRLYPKNKYFKEVGAKATSTFPKVKHQIPMGSQAKINTVEEFNDWALKIKKQTKEESFLITEKLDGLSLSLVYEKGKLVKAITRGDGIEGEDIFPNAKKMKNVLLDIPLKDNVILRGEIILLKDIFEKKFSDKANPRNAAAGTIRRLDGERCEFLSFYAYDISLDFKTEEEKINLIKKLGFKTPNLKITKNAEEVINLWKEYEEKIRESLNYEIDGLVVTVNSKKAQDQLGIIDQRPRYSRAFKFQPQRVSSKIVKINWQTGRTGRVTPVAEIVPVKVGGVLVTNLSVHNLSEIRRLNLKLDSDVIVKRAGDVIPQIEEVLSGEKEIQIPEVCPSCNKKLIEEEIFLVCENTNCPAQIEGSLLTWVETLEIRGLGEELVKKLLSLDLVKTPVDFYKLDVLTLANLDRMGDKSASKIIDQIKNKNKLTLPKLIKALAIPQVSEKIMELVIPYYNSLEKLEKVEIEDLTKIQGIGEISANQLLTGIKERKWLKEILSYIEIVQPKEVGTKLKDQTFCFTGFRDKNLEQEIIQNGGKILSAISKNLNYLVAADIEDSSSKIKKAKDLNVKIISIEEAKKIINS